MNSLRHTFTDALRQAGATGEVIDGMLGMIPQQHEGPLRLRPWIMMFAEVTQKVEYPGLHLTHVHSASKRNRERS